VPHFTAATAYRYNNARKCDISNEILRKHAVSGKGKAYKNAKRYANKVKQCCEVCKKPVVIRIRTKHQE